MKKDSEVAVEKVMESTTINGKVKIQSLYTSHLKYTGQATGLPYEWPSAGTVVMVDSSDADYLLSLRFGGVGCCGGNSNGNTIFAIYKE
jgi:hypothetical protein